MACYINLVQTVNSFTAVLELIWYALVLVGCIEAVMSVGLHLDIICQSVG